MDPKSTAMDSLLDEALDELEDDYMSKTYTSTGTSQQSASADAAGSAKSSSNSMRQDDNMKNSVAVKPSSWEESTSNPVVFGPPRPPYMVGEKNKKKKKNGTNKTGPTVVEDEAEKALTGLMEEMLRMAPAGQGGGMEDPPPEAIMGFLKQMQDQISSEFQMFENHQKEEQRKKDKSKQQERKPQESTISQNSLEETSTKEPCNGTTSTKDTNVDPAVARVLGDMRAEQQKQERVHHTEFPSFPNDPNDPDAHRILQNLIQGFQGMDVPFNDDSADALMEGLMEQLMSKELMYEPMKQVALKFPSWLEKHRATLSSEEYKRREEQFKCFQELVRTYEMDESVDKQGGTQRLIELMQQVQEFGQPPTEIVKSIAPGIELDEDGNPKFDPFDPKSGECLIM